MSSAASLLTFNDAHKHEAHKQEASSKHTSESLFGKVSSLTSGLSSRVVKGLFGFRKSSENSHERNNAAERETREEDFTDPRLLVRQLLGEGAGRRVKSVMASPESIRGLINDHKSLIELKEKQALGELAVKREQRALKLEKERLKRKTRWQAKYSVKEDAVNNEEYLAVIEEEERRRQAIKGRTIADYDVVWHTATLGSTLGVNDYETRTWGNLGLRQVDPSVDGKENLEIPQNTAEEVLSGTLTPWSVCTLPEQHRHAEGEMLPYGSDKQHREEGETWSEIFERANISLKKDRNVARARVRAKLGFAPELKLEEVPLATEDFSQIPTALRQDRFASSAEEHQRLPYDERKWSFIPRQRVRLDVLAMAGRTKTSDEQAGR